MVGVLLILGGLGLLGWFAWQYFGTNVVAKQKQAEIKEATVTQWKNGIEGDAVALLRVDRFGKDFEVPIVKGFDDASLAEGVGMYPDGAKPGQVGNFAIAGHRVTHGEPFRDFLELKKGDRVEVETRTKVYVYELENDGDDITVDFTVSWPLWKVPDPDANGEPPESAKLTMLTCSELFHTRNRNVVVGDLVQTIDKATTEPPPERAEPSPAAAKSD
jgi:sortase A